MGETWVSTEEVRARSSLDTAIQSVSSLVDEKHGCFTVHASFMVICRIMPLMGDGEPRDEDTIF